MFNREERNMLGKMLSHLVNNQQVIFTKLERMERQTVIGFIRFLWRKLPRRKDGKPT
jgi:hypothetical protein